MGHVVVRFAVWLAFVVVAGTATASGLPTKHCPGKVAAARYGVRLVASDIRIRASTYNATTVQNRSIWPALGCGKARSVLHAFLTAKLHRPLNKCTVPALQGKGCKVDHWLCYAGNDRQPLISQACSHFVFDRDGPLRRSTTIFFRETDHDHG